MEAWETGAHGHNASTVRKPERGFAITPLLPHVETAVLVPPFKPRLAQIQVNSNHQFENLQNNTFIIAEFAAPINLYFTYSIYIQRYVETSKSGPKVGVMRTATSLDRVAASDNILIIRTTKSNVAWHRETSIWNANVRTEMDGMEDILKSMESDIAKTLHLGPRKRSQFSGIQIHNSIEFTRIKFIDK